VSLLLCRCFEKSLCSRVLFLDFAVAAFDTVLIFIAPLLFVCYRDIVNVIGIVVVSALVVALAVDVGFVAYVVSDLALVDDAAATFVYFTVGANVRRAPGSSSFAPGDAVSENVVNEVRSSDSDFVQSERREGGCGGAASGGDKDQKRNQQPTEIHEKRGANNTSSSGPTKLK
jgi:hypothetical protein